MPMWGALGEVLVNAGTDYHLKTANVKKHCLCSPHLHTALHVIKFLHKLMADKAEPSATKKHFS